MGKKKIALLVAASVLSGPIAANAASITYDFTGTVTSSSGIYSSIAEGTAVTGSYTINLANADATRSSGTVGSTMSNWTSQEASGSQAGVPPVAAYVFSSTAEIGGVSYSTGAAGTYYSYSGVSNGGCSCSTVFVGNEEQLSDANTGTSSSISITNENGAFSDNGAPIIAGATTATGGFQLYSDNTSNDVSYEITLLAPAPVPLPAAAWLTLSGLGGLGIFAKKKSAA